MAKRRDLLTTVDYFLGYEETKRQRQQLRRIASRLDPNVFADYVRGRPEIPPRIVALLAGNGIAWNDPLVDKVARLAGKAQESYGNALRSFSEKGLLTDAEQASYREASRTGNLDLLAHTTRRVTTRIKSMFGPSLVEQAVGDVAGTVGEVVGGTIDTANKILSPLDPFSSEHGGRASIENAAKQATRVGLTALQAPADYVSASVREAASRVNAGGPLGLFANDPSDPYQLQQTERLGSESQFGQVLGDLAHGRTPDTGTSILPSPASPTALRARQNALDHSPFLIDGQGFTLGRFMAQGPSALGIYEDGSFAFNAISGFVDAVVAFKADPTNLVLKSVSRARAAEHVFASEADNIAEQVAAGLARNPSPTVHGWQFESWLKTPGAQAVVADTAGQTDFELLRHRANGNVALALAYKDAKTPEEVTTALRVARTEESLTQVPRLEGAGYRVSRVLDDNFRFVHDMPGQVARLDKPDQFVNTWDAVQRNMRLTPETIAANNEVFARELVGGRGRAGILPIAERVMSQGMTRIIALNGVADDVAERAMQVAYEGGTWRGPRAIERQLLADGVAPKEAVRAAHIATEGRKATRLYLDSWEKARGYMLDDMGNNVNPGAVKIGSDFEQTPNPTDLNDFISAHMPTGDTRKIKEMTGALRHVYRIENDLGWAKRMAISATGGAALGGLLDASEGDDSWVDGALEGAALGGTFGAGGVHGSVRFLDTVMGSLFKPAVLIRPAWTIRVIGEEQIRMSVTGLDAFWNHPISFVGWVVGRPQSATTADLAFASAEAGWVDDFAEAMSGSGAAHILDNGSSGRSAIVLREKHPYTRADQLYPKAWADNLLRVYRGPFRRKIAAAFDDIAAGRRLTRLETEMSDEELAVLRQSDNAATGFPPLFHGTSQRFELDEGGGRVADNLMGAGFYTTDSPTVARSYKAKGAGTDPVVYSMKWQGAHPPRLADLEVPMPTDLRGAIRQWWGTIENADWIDYAEADGIRLHELLDDPAATGAETISQIRALLVGNGRTAANEVMDGFRAAMEQSGIDVMRYAGGARTGGEAHNAYVWLDPSQIQIDEKTSRRLVSLQGRFQEMTQRDTPNSIFDYFWSGDGKATRLEMLKSPSAQGILDDPVRFHQFLDDHADNISLLTRGNPDLMEVATKGTFRGKSIIATKGARRGEIAYDTDFINALDDARDTGPNVVLGDKQLSVNTHRANLGDKMDSAVRTAFDWLMTRTTNQLSRSPAFRQTFWQRQLQLLPSMTADAQQQVLRYARGEPTLDALDAGQELGGWMLRHAPRPVQAKLVAVPKKLQRALEAAASRGTGNLTADVAEQLSKAHALDNVEELLYNLSKRNQFFDSARLIMPFGEAFKEVTTTWAWLIKGDPSIIRRAQQLERAAEGSGTFYKDPNTGKTVFTYPAPFSYLLPGLVGAGPVKLTSNPSNLNLVGNGLPGFGPAPQIAVRELLPRKPDLDFIRKIVDPYGGTQPPGLLETATGLAAPRWIIDTAKLVGDPESLRGWGATVEQIRQYKFSTGAYGNSPEERQRLLADSTKAARWMFALRIFNKATLPAAPREDFQIADDDGHLHLVRTLANELHGLENEDPKIMRKFGADTAGYDLAPILMMDAYGEKAIAYLLQGGTRPSVGGLPTTQAGQQWLTDHPEVEKAAPNVAGYFALNKGPFDRSVIAAQTKQGKREPLSPLAQEQLANNRLARARYDYEKSRIPTNEVDSDKAHTYLRDLRTWLAERYPGYPNPAGVLSRADLDQQIRELKKAADLPSLTDNPVSRALREYFAARAEVEAEAQRVHIVNWQSAKKTRAGVQYLAQMQSWLTDKYPESVDVFDRVLSGDIKGA